MKRSLAFAVAALALGAAHATAATQAASIRATVAPASVHLGDPFRYTVEVRAAGAAASNLRLVADTGPFAEVAAPASSHESDHGTTVVRVVETLACLDRGCLASAQPRRVALPPPRALLDTQTISGAATSVTVVPRVSAQAVAAARARYRSDTAVPVAATPVAFDTAAAMAIAIAVALVGAALLLIVGGRRRRRATPPRERWAKGGLEVALRLLRESAARSAPDRRRAADFAARAVVTSGRPDVATEAERVAWAQSEPEPTDVTSLAGTIERAVGGGDRPE